MTTARINVKLCCAYGALQHKTGKRIRFLAHDRIYVLVCQGPTTRSYLLKLLVHQQDLAVHRTGSILGKKTYEDFLASDEGLRNWCRRGCWRKAPARPGQRRGHRQNHSCNRQTAVGRWWGWPNHRRRAIPCCLVGSDGQGRAVQQISHRVDNCLPQGRPQIGSRSSPIRRRCWL